MGKELNILYYVAVSELNNSASQRFLKEFASTDSVLLYEFLEPCEFKLPNKIINVINSYDLRKRLFRSIEGYYESEPVDTEILLKMSPFESQIYKMMDNYFPPQNHFDERQRIYYNALRLLNGIIDKHQIQVFVMMGVPHQNFDFIIYCLCKVKNIPTCMMYRLPITGYSYYFFDLEDHCINFCRVNDKNVLRKEFQESYNKYTDPTKEVKLYYMNQHGLQYTIKHCIERIKFARTREDLWCNIWIYLTLRRKRSRAVRFRNRLSRKPDYSKKYLYVGLQFQPEGTTSPLAGVFVNQYLIIQMLSYYVSEDILIYVKEHPNQRLGGEINYDFYKEISELRNVVIIDNDTSSSELENNCLAVVTCTGTMAYEAMYKRKPLLLFGYSVYNGIPGAFTIKNNEDCRNALSEIEKGIEITDQDILEFVKHLDSIGYQAEFALGLKQHMFNKGITLQANNDNLFKMMRDMIFQVKERFHLE